MSSHSATLHIKSPVLRRFADRFHVLVQHGDNLYGFIHKEAFEDYVCSFLYTKEPEVSIIYHGALWIISPYRYNRMQNFYHSDYWPGVSRYAKAALIARGRL